MFAFAMGGAENLSPIKSKITPSDKQKPNWNSFELAYNTIGSLNSLIGVLNMLIAVSMGWFGLKNILENYDYKTEVWTAFLIVQITSLVMFIFQRWKLALIGMNYVALINRWNIIFSLGSCIAGFITLLLNGNIIILALVMQAVSIAGVFRDRYLLSQVEGGRVLRFKYKVLKLDKEVIKWSFEPTWKGFIGEFGQSGSLQLSAIIYAGFSTTTETASYLFSLKMIQTIALLAQAPFSSVQPLMSRLLAKGDISILKKLTYQRVTISLCLFFVGIIIGSIIFPLFIEKLNSSLVFLPYPAWFLFGGLMLMAKFNLYCCSISAIGNVIIYYWHSAFGALIGAALLFYFKDVFGVYTPILTASIPGLILMNFGPFKNAVSILNKK